MRVQIGRSTTVSAVAGMYSSHPSIARTRAGDWLLVFSRSGDPEGSLIHPPNDPRFVNVITRSTDEGRSWSTPKVVPGESWTGVECSGITELTDGTILLNQFRFEWRPVDAARRLWAQGMLRPFILDPDEQRWRPVADERDWAYHTLPYVRADDGSYVHRSMDGGERWETTRLDIAPYQGAFSPKGAVELADGEVVLALGSHEHDPLASTLLVRSSDSGRTWSRAVEVASVRGLVFSEPTVVATGADRLLVFSREETTGFVYQSVSMDRGHTWLPPERLRLWGHPTHAHRLDDGRVIIVYGVRRRPFGINASLSEDEGRTWGPEIAIRSGLIDTRNGFNLGYPSVIEYGPGELFVAYYAEDGIGVVGILGTYVSIDGSGHRVRPERPTIEEPWIAS